MLGKPYRSSRRVFKEKPPSGRKTGPARLRLASLHAGFGLTEVLVAAFIGGLVIAGMTAYFGNADRFIRKSGSLLNLETVKAKLFTDLSCPNTFATKTLGSPCPAGQWIPLLSKTNAVILPAAGGVVGDWFVRARCDNANGSLEIRAARLSTGHNASAEDWTSAQASVASNFRKDEIGSDLPYNWSHPKSLMWPLGTSGICNNWFSGTSTTTSCSGAGKYVRAVNFLTSSVDCGTIPVCGGGSSLQWNGTDFYCTDLSTIYTPKTVTNSRIVRYGTLNAQGIPCNILGAFGAMWLSKGTATCDPGYVAVGGGVTCDHGFGGPITMSHVIGTNAWEGWCCRIARS